MSIIEGKKLPDIFPQDNRISILNMFIYRERQSSGYNLTSDRKLSTGTHITYGFGVAVENKSNVSISIDIEISQVDRRGFTLHNLSMRETLEAGTKKRILQDLYIWHTLNLNQFNIKSISFNNSNTTLPNKTLSEIFKKSQKTLFSESINIYRIILALIIIFLLYKAFTGG